MLKVYLVFARDCRDPLIIFKTREQAEEWIKSCGYTHNWIHEMYVED